MAVSRSLALVLVLALCPVPPVAAADAPAPPAAAGADAALANANNPLANMTAFNVQNYWLSSLYDTDATASTAWLRFAKPIGRVLVRASLPLNTISVPGAGTTSGVGDFNVFGAYLLSDPASPQQFGVGPLLAAPTASEDALGSDVWQAGAAAVYFNAASPVVQWGGLLTAQTKIGGDGPDTSLAVLQPFLFLQFGKGAYGGMAPLWVFDLESGEYAVPLGCRVGKVVKAGRTVFNVFIEPQFTMVHWGAGQPEFQVFTGINMQFLPQ
jgi:hypothetical protein